MKKILIIVGAILLIGGVAAGSFWGGMTYQSNQVKQARANFENSRGPLNAGQMDLQPGMQVTVTGQRDSNGDITASRVMILSEDSGSATGVLPPPDPTAVGTEP